MERIRLENIHKSYRSGDSRVEILRGIDWRVKDNDLIAITGPSGSGKSTLLNLIGAIDFPDQGKIWIDGIEPFMLRDRDMARMRREKIGFVFQSFHLIPVLKAWENVACPLVLRGDGRRSRRARAFELLEMVGLRDLAHRMPGHLSGGERQRVAIARALACNPPVILADEPTANLHSGATHALMRTLKRLGEESGACFVFSTHDPIVAEYARHGWQLVKGKLVNTSAVQAAQMEEKKLVS